MTAVQNEGKVQKGFFLWHFKLSLFTINEFFANLEVF